MRRKLVAAVVMMSDRGKASLRAFGLENKAKKVGD